MANLADLTELKRKVEKYKKESDRAAGALDAAMKQLKKEFGCDTLQEAKRELKRLEKEEADAKQGYERLLAEFEKEWGDALAPE